MAAWTLLHDVAYLYLFLAADADRAMDEAELVVLAERLQRHAPERDEAYVHRVIDEAWTAARQRARPVHAIVESLKYAALPDEARRAVLDDLIRIARADGRLHVNEVAFIRALAKVWKLDLPEPLPPADR